MVLHAFLYAKPSGEVDSIWKYIPLCRLAEEPIIPIV